MAQTQALRPGRAVVVFSGKVTLWWLRFLRPGFRHCFVLIESGGQWIAYNPMSNGCEFAVWAGLGEDAVCRSLNASGYTAIGVNVRPLRSGAYPWRPYTCVEVVMRALNLRTAWVFTPWQLYRFLQKEEKKQESRKKSLTFWIA